MITILPEEVFSEVLSSIQDRRQNKMKEEMMMHDSHSADSLDMLGRWQSVFCYAFSSCYGSVKLFSQNCSA